MEGTKKPRVVFPYVEAGLGHIMPLRAVADAFEKKYGDKAEIKSLYFFKETQNPALMQVENELIKEVKLHNKNRLRGTFQFFMMMLVGSRISLKYLMERRYKCGFLPALELIEKVDADLIFSTHFSTLYYSCAARKRRMTKATVMAYCPDPVIARQWDNRADLIGISSQAGIKRAVLSLRYYKSQLMYIPFLIRDTVGSMVYGRQHYRRELGLPENKFTVLLADGAYGAGKLRKTVYSLLKSKREMTVIAVCGKNEQLYNELKNVVPPPNITFALYGFTDKMLVLSASCDVFVGKAGASNLAEPSYFGAPSIVTFCATPIEKWICRHYVKHVGCAVKMNNINKVVKLVENWADNPDLMEKYVQASKSQHRFDGPEQLADKIWENLQNKTDLSHNSDSKYHFYGESKLKTLLALFKIKRCKNKKN